MKIVGGVYLERCLSPEWRQLFGSGLRAAAAVSQLTATQLVTYVSSEHHKTFVALTNTFKFKFTIHQSPVTPTFSYNHPLAKPEIHPEPRSLSQVAPLKVNGSVILRFGMLEGDCVAHGDRVVYDPQNPLNPRPFHENGSHANHLVLVANQREVLALAKKRSLDDAIRFLLTRSGAEAVVVKQGMRGALVATRKRRQLIHSFQTPKIFKIGSGDVFSAVFACMWGRKNNSVFQAAVAASRAAACYCNSRVLPIPLRLDMATRNFKAFAPKTHARKPRVYLAGPFFTLAERWLIEETREALLGSGLDVFSPLHDVGYGDGNAVASKDIEGLKSCDAVFAVLDGMDSGTVFEVGYARSLGLPVIGFVQNEPEEPKKMFVGTRCELLDDFASAVYRVAWAAYDRKSK